MKNESLKRNSKYKEHFRNRDLPKNIKDRQKRDERNISHILNQNKLRNKCSICGSIIIPRTAIEHYQQHDEFFVIEGMRRK